MGLKLDALDVKLLDTYKRFQLGIVPVVTIEDWSNKLGYQVAEEDSVLIYDDRGEWYFRLHPGARLLADGWPVPRLVIGVEVHPVSSEVWQPRIEELAGLGLLQRDPPELRRPLRYPDIPYYRSDGVLVHIRRTYELEGALPKATWRPDKDGNGRWYDASDVVATKDDEQAMQERCWYDIDVTLDGKNVAELETGWTDIGAAAYHTLTPAGFGALRSIPSGGGSELITTSVAENEFHVSPSTLRRLMKAGELTDHRPTGHKPNAPLIISRAELASKYPRKDTS